MFTLAQGELVEMSICPDPALELLDSGTHQAIRLGSIGRPRHARDGRAQLVYRPAMKSRTEDNRSWHPRFSSERKECALRHSKELRGLCLIEQRRHPCYLVGRRIGFRWPVSFRCQAI